MTFGPTLLFSFLFLIGQFCIVDQWLVTTCTQRVLHVADSKNTYRKYKTSDIERDVENRHEQVGDCQIDDEDICD